MNPYQRIIVRETITASNNTCYQIDGPTGSSDSVPVIALTTAELVRIVLAKLNIGVSTENCEALVASAARLCNACRETEITTFDDLCEDCLSDLGV
jgi:hypothetical protein